MQTHYIMMDDTRTPLAFRCRRPDGSIVDLTSKTVFFHMVNSAGSDKVAETSSNVTVNDAKAGLVQYDFQAADVDTAGTYYAYFVVKDTGDEAANTETFPAIARQFRIVIGTP